MVPFNNTEQLTLTSDNDKTVILVISDCNSSMAMIISGESDEEETSLFFSVKEAELIRDWLNHAIYCKPPFA